MGFHVNIWKSYGSSTVNTTLSRLVANVIPASLCFQEGLLEYSGSSFKKAEERGHQVIRNHHMTAVATITCIFECGSVTDYREVRPPGAFSFGIPTSVR